VPAAHRAIAPFEVLTLRYDPRLADTAGGDRGTLMDDEFGVDSLDPRQASTPPSAGHFVSVRTARRSRRVTAAVLLLACAPPLLGEQPPAPVPFPIPLIEQRAPDAFVPGERANVAEATYRMDGTVLLPMLFTSVPIWSTSGVGVARVTAAEYAPDAQRVVRTFEFFARSFPERAHGVNRVGMFREVQELLLGEAVRTTYFGAMSLSPDATLAEAQAALNTAASGTMYDLLDGSGTSSEEVSAMHRMPGAAAPANAEALYAQVRPGVATTARSSGRLAGDTAPLPTQSFLAALHASLVDLAARGTTVQRLPLPRRSVFAYNALPRFLDLIKLDRDPRAGRQRGAQNIVRHPEAVYRLTYRLSRPNRRATTDFTVWAELQAARPSDAGPVVPLAFFVQPRSFVRLTFERTY
jgi:hypothetical protein